MGTYLPHEMHPRPFVEARTTRHVGALLAWFACRTVSTEPFTSHARCLARQSLIVLETHSANGYP